MIPAVRRESNYFCNAIFCNASDIRIRARVMAQVVAVWMMQSATLGDELQRGLRRIEFSDGEAFGPEAYVFGNSSAMTSASV
jgi:hypothetical protein